MDKEKKNAPLTEQKQEQKKTDESPKTSMKRNAGEPEKIIELMNVKKIYRMGAERIHAVDDVSFDIKKGEFCCLLGTSGSGKSTLLNLMAGIEKASAGKILIKGKNIPKMSENQLAKFRQKYLGFVFQSYNLINSMTALENVEFPLVFKRVRPKKRRKLAKEILTKVGLGTRLAHKPKEMSGGQQQRVGIARAFVAKPAIVFADEPTGNLDTRTTIEVMSLIKQMAKDNQQTIVMVTHDRSLAAYADKIIHILDGKITSVEIPDRTGQEDLQTQLKELSERLLKERGGDSQEAAAATETPTDSTQETKEAPETDESQEKKTSEMKEIVPETVSSQEEKISETKEEAQDVIQEPQNEENSHLQITQESRPENNTVQEHGKDQVL